MKPQPWHQPRQLPTCLHPPVVALQDVRPLFQRLPPGSGHWGQCRADRQGLRPFGRPACGRGGSRSSVRCSRVQPLERRQEPLQERGQPAQLGALEQQVLQRLGRSGLRKGLRLGLWPSRQQFPLPSPQSSRWFHPRGPCSPQASTQQPGSPPERTPHPYRLYLIQQRERIRLAPPCLRAV